MENRNHGPEDETSMEADELVEYALEEELEEEQEDVVEPIAQEELEDEEEEVEQEIEDVADEGALSEDAAEEVYYVDEEHEEDNDETGSTAEVERSKPAVAGTKLPTVLSTACAKMPATSKIISQVPARQPVARLNSVVVMPQSSRPMQASATMKLLNNTKKTTAAETTSYHLVNADGKVIMKQNVIIQPPGPAVLKRAIPLPSGQQQPATKVMIDSKARIVQIQPKSVPSTSGAPVLTKTVTLTKAAPPFAGSKTLTVKTLPSGTVKMLAHPSPTAASPTTLRVAKAALPGQGTSTSLIAPRIIKTGTGNAGEPTKIILNAGMNNSAVLTKKPVPADGHAVNVPVVKGLQYVRVVNPIPSGSKFIVQPTNKTGTFTAVGHQLRPTGAALAAASSSSTGPSKIILQNNKAYVVRNGSVHVASTPTTTCSMLPVLPVPRKLVISGNKIQTQENVGTGIGTRIFVRKEDFKPTQKHIHHTVVATPKPAPNGAGSVVKVTDKGEQKKQFKEEAEVVATPTASQKNVYVGMEPEDLVKEEMSKLAEEAEDRKPDSFPGELYKKRSCNCTKSQCLKLYCDCFANGELCFSCNCKDCHNTQDFEGDRQKAIRITLERNPNAFKPKIGSIGTRDAGKRLHTKGCNCKRSGCLKNYCECYEAKIPCSSNCKCAGCRNTTQFVNEFQFCRGSPNHLPRFEGQLANSGAFNKSSHFGNIKDEVDDMMKSFGDTSFPMDIDWSKVQPSKQPHNFMTPDVIEATLQCMIARNDECQRRGSSIRTTERLVLQEFNRCLVEIMDFASAIDADDTAGSLATET
ncbi:protein lin-54 homolog [Anopheles bellator]|uniref:protein lin-54 homolog n=1 Tax=Anopheles bellator TaxID=139047 RepID=UPI00264A30B6|nr:protein lin-54 homolog [Anopheles bellator]